MNNQDYKKTFLSIILTILSIGLFWISPVFAQDNLKVEFENTPLFDKVNFLPGDTITRWVDVTNDSGETKKIGLEIVNQYLCSESCLSDALSLVVSEDNNILYSGSLATFYEAGEKVLSDLGTGETTRYHFSTTFNPDVGNNYQDTTTSFDIKIGFFGKESIGKEMTSDGYIGGDKIIVAGLTIFDENVSDINVNETTITWKTNLDSTSRVIYSPEGFPHLLQVNNPPNYGYVFLTDEDLNKTTDHKITITGLLPGTTYYYRCVSHGSLAVSTEYSFTTSGVKPEEDKINEEIEEKGTIEDKEEDKEKDEEKNIIVKGKKEENEPKNGTNPFLAAIGGLFKLENFWWILILFAVILIVLFLLRKKRRDKEINKEI